MRATMRAVAMAMGLMVGGGACDPAGVELAVTVEKAQFSDCNGIIVGLDVDLKVDNTSDGSIEVTRVELDAEDGSVVGSDDDFGQVIAAGDALVVHLIADSCVDPKMHLSKPTATNVPLTVTVHVRDPETGDAGVTHIATSMLYVPGFDNCASGFGSPGEGCGNF